ncbi:hypothetical protein FRC02_006104 [Tulasnella sp. 418]|nr:hypothetical protein FRC02_006104 [Tulasnella sp. 418]
MRAIKSTFQKHLKAIKKKDPRDTPISGVGASSIDTPVVGVVGSSIDTPVLGVVGSSIVAGGDEDNEDTPEILKIRRMCPRFRILIIGKANSGKTTILQKMCGTTDTPVVIDKDGKKIDPSILEDPTVMRGMHDIENEISYPSNCRFVFHDSMGFEAGSVDEMDKVRNFIAQRSSSQGDLKDMLHVIWFCVPMDTGRVLSNAELAFFENGTGDGRSTSHNHVIVGRIFTSE